MDVDICTVCGVLAKFKCARCKQVAYCKKDCQIKNWPQHKVNCTVKTPESIRAEFIQQANNRIAGNILIMAAHNYEKYSLGVIFTEITETIEEFMKGGSTHFAHLQFVPKDEINEMVSKYELCKINVSELKLSTEKVHVVYCFNNYNYSLTIQPKNKLNALVNQHPCPENIWSVVFDL
ncbi:zinc finger MYNd domain-containing protein [Pacmanvirus S19]|nr:zinc finger MYNd domain-containing protein [Pacmanvirus S19]